MTPEFIMEVALWVIAACILTCLRDIRRHLETIGTLLLAICEERAPETVIMKALHESLDEMLARERASYNGKDT